MICRVILRNKSAGIVSRVQGLCRECRDCVESAGIVSKGQGLCRECRDCVKSAGIVSRVGVDDLEEHLRQKR